MSLGYEVSRRAPNGEPREIRCTTHADCTWVQAATARRDDDPIFVMQFQAHLRDTAQGTVAAFGHQRRART